MSNNSNAYCSTFQSSLRLDKNIPQHDTRVFLTGKSKEKKTLSIPLGFYNNVDKMRIIKNLHSDLKEQTKDKNKIANIAKD